MKRLAAVVAILMVSAACGSCAAAKPQVKIGEPVPIPKPSQPAQPDPMLPLLLDLLGGQEKVKLEVDYDPNANHKIGMVRFDKGVSEASAKELVEWIDAANSEKLEGLVIEFDTPGGSVDAGKKISKAIEGSKIPIYCLVDGDAASMGFYILQSCPVRLMTQRSVLMAHDPSMRGGGGQSQDMQNAADALKALSDAMAQHYCHRLKMSLKSCRAKFDHGLEWWMGWKEALEVGAVDKIAPPVQDVLYWLRRDNVIPAASLD